MNKERSFFDFLVRRGKPVNLKQISALPLEKPVEVFTDKVGIPHIFAQNEKDLYAAQGFFHAAERLWQMESIRRMASGTLAEIAGEGMADLDHFSQLMGFNAMRGRMIDALTEAETELCRAYAEGINAYIGYAGGDIPLEFQTLKIKPSSWTLRDIAGFIPLNAWFLQNNYMEEVLAVLTGKTMTEDLWNDLYAVYPGAPIPREDFFKRFASVEIGPIIPAALAFYPSLKGLTGNAADGGKVGVNLPDGLTGGSNNWALAKGKNGKPLFANDPHLENTLPQIWYFCHLSCPGINVCGASLPGVPGIVIGRNEQVTWGLTNVMTDCCDLFIVELDPANPYSYRVGGEYRNMDKETLSIPIAGGGSREITIARTIYGPVITELDAGFNVAAAVCWYGTYDGAFEDTTLRAVFAMNKARRAEEVMSAAKMLRSVGQNVVAADAEGNISWYASGAIPDRRGFSGRLPADGSSGECFWDGFLPPGENPSSFNPGSGYIATANHKTTDTAFPHAVTYSWAAPYRHRRIVELLTDRDGHTLDSFAAIQKDVYSKRAEAYLPVILSFSYTDVEAKEAADILKGWDGHMTAESRGGLVFQVFLYRFAETLLSDILGDYLPLYLMFSHLFYTALDVLFDTLPVTRRRESGEERPDGKAVLRGRDLGGLCEKALTETIRYIEKALGKKRGVWSWGKLHGYSYNHPGARGGMAARLLNRGPYPAPGSTGTINLAFYNPGKKGGPKKRFEVTAVPSLRFLTDMADPDSSRIMGPMGQSGRPGTEHYANMITPWMNVAYVTLPLSRLKCEELRMKKTILGP